MIQVFLEDENSPGRYILVAEKQTRPAGEALDDIIMDHLGIGSGNFKPAEQLCRSHVSRESTTGLDPAAFQTT